nr:MAG TPA: hypothetical protein [Caudoviricetes sp.]
MVSDYFPSHLSTSIFVRFPFSLFRDIGRPVFRIFNIYIKYEKNRLGFSVLILIKSSYSSVSPNSTEIFPIFLVPRYSLKKQRKSPF